MKRKKFENDNIRGEYWKDENDIVNINTVAKNTIDTIQVYKIKKKNKGEVIQLLRLFSCILKILHYPTSLYFHFLLDA